jgi:hypothetical protein
MGVQVLRELCVEMYVTYVRTYLRNYLLTFFEDYILRVWDLPVVKIMCLDHEKRVRKQE